MKVLSRFIPPVLSFLLLQLFETTSVTNSVMTAYNPATFRAVPLFRFLFQDPFDAILFDKFEVLYHAHVVKGAIALIKGF